MAADAAGNLYIADQQRVLKLAKGKLTTILLYLRNALNYVEAALLTAKSTSDADPQARLDSLRQHTRLEVTHIEDMRGAFDSTPPSS